MKLSYVLFKQSHNLGSTANANNEARNSFRWTEPGGPDALGRPIPPTPGIEIHLVLGGDWILVRQTPPKGSAALPEGFLVPREQVERVVPFGREGKPDPKIMQALVDGE